MALVFGKLFDRIGTAALIIGVGFSAASTPLVFLGSRTAALFGMALWGAGMGAQQTILRARIADLVPTEKRGSAYGIFNTVFGILWFAGSSAIGILYGWSVGAAVVFASAIQLSAVPLLLTVRRNAA
jgi:MFS family permease